MGIMRKFAAAAISGLLLSVGLPNVASAAPSIMEVRLDNRNPKIGDVINWLVDVDCSGLPIQQVMMYVQDPAGVKGWLTNSYRDIKSGTIGTKATVKIPFKITDEASAGNYKVQSVSMTCQNKAGGEYSWSGSLDSISFDLKTGSTSPSTTQPRIEKIELKSPAEVKVAEKIQINLSAIGTGKLNNVNLTLLAPNGVEINKNFNQYGQTPNGEASKRIETTFSFDVDEDWAEGSYRISAINIDGYAGIDLYNPEPDDPNPRNSTSSFARSVSVRAAGPLGQTVTGQPVNGAVSQPSLAAVSVKVINPNPVPVAPPEVVSISLPVEPIPAGTSFNLPISLDGKNAYIYNVNASFSESDNLSRTFSCSAQNLQKEALQKMWDGLILKCETQRTNSPGTYILRSIVLNTTTCNVPANSLYNQENQSCTQSPRMRYTNYNYQNGYGYVVTSPVVKSTLKNPLDELKKVSILAPPALQAPKYTSVTVEANQIKVFYPWTYEVSCDYTSSSGSVTSGTSDKISNVVTISGLKAATKVVLSGTCTALDKAKVSFAETFTTALPPAPVLPSVLSKTINMDSITLILSDLNQEDVDYEVDSTKGSITIAGDSLEITDLEPGESTIVTMTMTDIHGQSASGIIGTFVTEAPPKLLAPVVKLVSKKRNNYVFQFDRTKGITYTSRGVNCVVKISGENISVSNLVVGKTATAFLTATDQYGQKMTTKFLTAKLIAK